MAEETKRSTIRLKSKIQSSEDKKIDTKKSVKRTKVRVDTSSENISEKKIDENFDPLKVRNRLQIQFLFIFLLGSGIIWINLFPPMIQILISALLMAIFVSINFNKTKSIPTVRGVFADSVYYLGFLFTFVALVVAMMELTKEGFEIRAIVGSMGPALITTVIGMAFRIYFTQFDPITDEPETETFNTLGVLSSNLIKAMENLEKSTERNNKAFLTFQETINNQMITFSKKINELDFSNVSAQLDKFSKSINEIATTGNNLKETANRSAIVIENAKDKLENLDNNIDNANKKLKDINNLKSDITELNDKIDNSKEEISSAVDNAKTSLKNVSLKMENNVSAVATQINLSANKITKQLSDAEKQAIEYTGTLKRSLSDVIDFLNRHK